MLVNIQSLKNGRFDLEESVDLSDVQLDTDDVEFLNTFKVSIVGEKFHLNYRMTISFDGEVKFPCDRCAEPFVCSISDSTSVIYTKTDMTDDESDEEIIRIENDAKDIDISNELVEAIVLSFPMKRIHDSACKGVCACGANLNKEECTCEEKIDPRWEALVKLKNKN